MFACHCIVKHLLVPYCLFALIKISIVYVYVQYSSNLRIVLVIALVSSSDHFICSAYTYNIRQYIFSNRSQTIRIVQFSFYWSSYIITCRVVFAGGVLVVYLYYLYTVYCDSIYDLPFLIIHLLFVNFYAIMLALCINCPFAYTPTLYELSCCIYAITLYKLSFCLLTYSVKIFILFTHLLYMNFRSTCASVLYSPALPPTHLLRMCNPF